ncbi:MAG: ABC transporter substrate-binding protein [Thermomicrobiaceae bacterium]
MESRKLDGQTLRGFLSENALSRRTFLKRSAVVGLAVPSVSALLAACGGDDEEPAEDDEAEDESTDPGADTEDEEEPAEDDEDADEGDDAEEGEEAAGEGQVGGTLEVALIGEPPTFDLHQTTATIVALICWHMYEPLFTWDGEFEVTEELAESLEVSDDGMLNTLTLRQGVMFHNGDEMTSADVVASIERWGEISGLGGNLMALVDNIEQVDDYTIEFNMSEPYGAFAVALARQNQGCAIYPQSVIESSDETSLAENIGTGPYQFVEHQPDQHIILERFEDYVGREEESSGYAGAKNQYLDQLRFVPVPDDASRVSGLQAGDYHYLESIASDNYETLEGDENAEVEVLPPDGWATFVMNTESGPMANQTLRQAVQAALDHEEILIGAWGEDFYRLDPSIMLQETVWHSTVGEDLYNINDPERAQELMEEAGYEGETIRIMTTEEYAEQFAYATIGEQQLTDAGFTIEVEVFDWSTLVERRNDPEAWDIFTTGISFRVDPIQLPPLQGCDWPGWWCSDEKVEWNAPLEQAPEFEDRFEAFEEIQQLFYEQVPMIKFGDTISITARSPMLQNFQSTPTQLQPAFWNIWLEE